MKSPTTCIRAPFQTCDLGYRDVEEYGVYVLLFSSSAGHTTRLGRGEGSTVRWVAGDDRVVLQRNRGAVISRLRQQLHGTLPPPARDLPGAARRPHERPLLQGHQEDQTELQDAPKVTSLPQVVEGPLLARTRPPLSLPPPTILPPPCLSGSSLLAAKEVVDGRRYTRTHTLQGREECTLLDLNISSG